MLRMALAERPAGFDPLDADGTSTGLATLVFGGLYTYDRSTGLVPHLAAGEPTIENERREYVVEIRNDAQFQHDRPVTAEDVQYSFSLAREIRDPDAPLPSVLEAVEPIDDRTVRFVLSEAYAPFPHLLTEHVVPRDVREEDPDRFDVRPIGTGPFRIVERLPDESLRLEKWVDYWGDPLPELDRIELPIIETPTNRVNALASGNADVIEAIPAALYGDIEDLPTAEVVEETAMDYVHLAFNCRAGPSADPAVREAVDYCVSLDTAVADFVEPAGVRIYSPLPPSLAADWELPVEKWREIPHQKDVEAAHELFEAAEVPPEWTATILVPDREVFEQLAIAVANGLREAGYSASVEPLDPETFQEVRVTGDPDDYDMYIDRWTGPPDPDAFTYPLFARETEGETNGTYYRAKSVQERIETARRTVRRAERRDRYESAITTLLEERAHLPIFVDQYSFAVSEAVQDFQAHPVTEFRVVSEYNNVSVTG